jgi:hypothetical protein
VCDDEFRIINWEQITINHRWNAISGEPKFNAWNKSSGGSGRAATPKSSRSDLHVTLHNASTTNCWAYAEREQENQHRSAKMQAEQATIQAILRTLII